MPTLRQLYTGRPSEMTAHDLAEWRAYFRLKRELEEREELKREVVAGVEGRVQAMRK